MKQLTITAHQTSENGVTVNVGTNTYTIEGWDILNREYRITVDGVKTAADAMGAIMLYFCGLFTATATKA